MSRKLTNWLIAAVTALAVGTADASAMAPVSQADNGGVTANPVDVPDWQPTGLTGPVYRLFTPASGAFLAVADQGLMRSDDGGDSWRAVPLPFAPVSGVPVQVAVDPSSHVHLFAAGPAGLYRTGDDAASWTLVLPTPKERVLQVAVSPLDSRLVYVALTGSSSISGDWRFLRSRDDGATFQQLEESHYSLCGMGVRILLPDPRSAGGLFRASSCSAGRTTNVALQASNDQGTTFAPIFQESLEYATDLVGGLGAQPNRFYLASVRDSRAGGGTLYRSDDGAMSWRSVLAYRSEASAIGPTGPSVTVGRVTYDPSQPDHVWVALGGDGDGVQLSADGGGTWQDWGGHGLGVAKQLSLGIDSQNLFLATDQGLWRQPLSADVFAGRAAPRDSGTQAPPDSADPSNA